MNKRELIAKVSGDSGISRDQAEDVVKSLLEAITVTLKSGGKFTLVGFGTFSVSKKAARIGRNPKTGDVIKIKAKKVARFKASRSLKFRRGGGTDDTGPMKTKK